MVKAIVGDGIVGRFSTVLVMDDRSPPVDHDVTITQRGGPAVGALRRVGAATA